MCRNDPFFRLLFQTRFHLLHMCDSIYCRLWYLVNAPKTFLFLYFFFLFIYLFIFFWEGGIFLDKSVPYLILCHGTPYVVIYTPNPFFKKGLSIDTTTILIRCTLGIKITIKNILKMITLVAEWPP